jgi:hypothetical protein
MTKNQRKKTKRVPRKPKPDEPAHSKHKTVRVQSDGLDANIDEEIAPLIRELWKARLITMMSCQDSPEGWVWVQFPLVVFAEAFMDLMEKESGVRPLWHRWRFEIYPITLQEALFGDYPKELIPKGRGLRFAIGVRFPKEDLPAVLETLVKHNAAIRSGSGG